MLCLHVDKEPWQAKVGKQEQPLKLAGFMLNVMKTKLANLRGSQTKEREFHRDCAAVHHDLTAQNQSPGESVHGS